jgi:hypothetical protein
MTPGLRAEYPIILPSGRVVWPTPGNHWRCAEDTFNQALTDNRVYFGKDGDALPIVKTYLSDVTDVSLILIDSGRVVTVRRGVQDGVTRRRIDQWQCSRFRFAAASTGRRESWVQ